MFYTICFAIVAFILGWLLGVRNIKQLETLADRLEKGAEAIEEMDMTDIESFNAALRQNRRAEVESGIELLLHIEEGRDAREYLINSIGREYIDLEDNEEVTDPMEIEENQRLVQRIESLSEKYPSFQKVITYTDDDD